MDANKMQKVKGNKPYKVIILMYCQANEFIYSFCREFGQVLWRKYTNGNLEKDSLVLINES